jgi:hypothetical protein
MTAIRRTLVLGLAVLLAGATAAADTVTTGREVISCWVESASADSVLLRLPRGDMRILNTRDVHEIRLSDSRRVAELAVQLPHVRVTLDSGQSVLPPAVRAREMTRLRLDRTREALPNGLPWYAGGMDTLALNPSQVEMAARCLDMYDALRECGRLDDSVVELLHAVLREEAALRRIWPQATGRLVSGGCAGLLAMSIGALVGASLGFEGGVYGYATTDWDPFVKGCAAGSAVGCAAGSVIGTAVYAAHRRSLIARHRDRVNDLVRRVNRAVAFQP